MIINKITGDKYLIHYSKIEQYIIINSIAIIIDELAGEIFTRTGFSDTRYLEFSNKLINHDNEIQVTIDEIDMVHNALNEVCNGLDLINEKLPAERVVLMEMLNTIG